MVILKCSCSVCRPQASATGHERDKLRRTWAQTVRSSTLDDIWGSRVFGSRVLSQCIKIHILVAVSWRYMFMQANKPVLSEFPVEIPRISYYFIIIPSFEESALSYQTMSWTKNAEVDFEHNRSAGVSWRCLFEQANVECCQSTRLKYQGYTHLVHIRFIQWNAKNIIVFYHHT